MPGSKPEIDNKLSIHFSAFCTDQVNVYSEVNAYDFSRAMLSLVSAHIYAEVISSDFH